MNGYGLTLAVITFFIIGIFHPIVIKAEYHFSRRCWPAFLAAGLLLIGSSFFAGNTMISCISGVTGCSCLWSIKELFEQHNRVKKGWFPANPKREAQESQESNKTC